jgi:hypothetical protein
MQLKYRGVKRRQKITDEIQRRVCRKVLLIPRSSVNDATDWELGKKVGKIKISCSVVNFY